MDVTQNNYKLKGELDVTKESFKNTQLKQEKEWVDQIVGLQRTEDVWNKKNRAEIIADLRTTYADQANEYNENKAISI